MDRLQGLLGMVVLLGIAFLLSNNRARINWKTVCVGVGLQIILGVILLKMGPVSSAFRVLSDRVEEFLRMSDQGANFVFGSLVDSVMLSKLIVSAQNSEWVQQADLTGAELGIGFVFAFKVLPTIIFFSAFISVMYYLGVIQRLIRGVAWMMRKTMGTSGSETLSCSGNIFVGQTEGPLLIRPYLGKMTQSELCAVMCGGFATIAGGVMAGYISMGIPAHHLIIASVMSAPAALVMAKILVPETEHSETMGDVQLPDIKVGGNVLDAAANGTSDGLKLALNVGAMLISFIALIAVVNWIFGGIEYVIDHKILGGELMSNGEYNGIFPGSLKTLFGTLFAPIAFVMGVPWSDSGEIGNLLGQKICVNEFVAYAILGNLIDGGGLEEKSVIVATYALCGFANFASIGIQIGGISALAPNRRQDLSRLALKAMLGGALASWMTATISGILI